MLRQTEVVEHSSFDYEDVRIYWEDDSFIVDDVHYNWVYRNPHASRFFTLKSDFHEVDGEAMWHGPMGWKPSGDPYWDNRSSP